MAIWCNAIWYKAMGLRTYRLALLTCVLALLLALGMACEGDPTAAPTGASLPSGTVGPTASPAAPSTPEQAATAPASPSPTEPTAAATAEPATPPAPRPTSPSAPATPTPAPIEPPSAFPVVITDSNGNDVVFEEPPQRIVAYNAVAVETLFAMGEGHRVAGTHDFVTYPPEADAVPKVGDAFNVNAENILETDPDLIYVFFASSYDQVKDLGITVLYLESPTTLDGIPERMRMWGRITANVDAAETLASAYESRLDALLGKLSAVDRGPRILYDVGGAWTVGPDTIIGQLLDLLKAENVAGDLTGWSQISPEVVVERDPEVIITGTAQEFLGNPAFQDVSAVKSRRLYAVEPSGVLSVFGPRFIEGVEGLARLLHPSVFAFPVVVTDSNGNDVTFDAPPERIVALTSVVVEILFALGEGHRIVGTHDFVSYPPEADDVPRMGSAFQVNTEQVVAADPDLISVFYASSYEQVEGLGPTVFYLDSPSTLDGILDRMRLWGRIVGRWEAGERLALEFETKLNDLLDRLASLEQGPRLFHDDSLLYTRGPGTVLGQVYDLLKAQNIAHDIEGYGQLSPEVLVERDPEVIIVTFPSRVQEFMEDPAFQEVSAIKNGRVYAVEPDGLVSVFGTRFIEGIEFLARVIHPDRFE